MPFFLPSTLCVSIPPPIGFWSDSEDWFLGWNSLIYDPLRAYTCWGSNHNKQGFISAGLTGTTCRVSFEEGRAEARRRKRCKVYLFEITFILKTILLLKPSPRCAQTRWLLTVPPLPPNLPPKYRYLPKSQLYTHTHIYTHALRHVMSSFYCC
jgi:hypothetical protein